MPIDYKKYPANWKSEIRPAILKRAENKCEFCGVKNYSIGLRNKEGIFYTVDFITEELESTGLDMFEDELLHCVLIDGSVNPIKIVLTIAHLDHDIKNNDYSNLRALCQRCHNRHDVGFRKQNRDKNKLKLF